MFLRHMLLTVLIASSIGFATGLLRDLGGGLTPLFLLGAGYPFLARRKEAFLWLAGFALAEGLPYLQALAPHGSLGLLSALAVPIGGFAIMAPAFLLSAPWARLLVWGALEVVWWEGLGFTVLDLGTGLADSALVLVASLGGVHLASVVAAGLGALPWWRPALAPLLLLALVPPPQAEPGDRWALVVQGGQSPEAKEVNWRKGQNPYPGLTASALKASQSPAPDLVVWPETASALPYFGAEKVVWIGGVGGAENNAVYLTEGGAVVAARSKAYFIPGRERAGWLAPVRSRAYLQAGFTPPQGDLPRGELKPLGRLGVLICYEAMLSVPAATLAAMGAEALVIVSNEGAFDGTLLKRRRLRQDRLHAVETSLWVVRATETGPSGSVDPRGHPALLSPEGERGAWLVPFGYRTGQTPYVALVRALTGGGVR
jgi:apolipoprotein N-acyltransferase